MQTMTRFRLTSVTDRLQELYITRVMERMRDRLPLGVALNENGREQAAWGYR